MSVSRDEGFQLCVPLGSGLGDTNPSGLAPAHPSSQVGMGQGCVHGVCSLGSRAVGEP